MSLDQICRRDAAPLDDAPRTAAEPKSKRRPLPVATLVVIDLLLLAAALAVFMTFQMWLPQRYEVAQSPTAAATITPSASSATSAVESGLATAEDAEDAEGAEGGAGSGAVVARPAATGTAAAGAAATAGATATTTTTATSAATATEVATTDLGGGKFADKFTSGEVISTATSYVSANVNVTQSTMQQDGVTYYVQDIYLRNIGNLRAAFAEDTYGKAIVDWVLNMAQDNAAIAAINGDYYGTGTIGVVIRNGTLYSDNVTGDVLVLFYDGVMKVYSAAEFDVDAVMAQGAYQAWSFGPSLLTADGQALSGFRGGISRANPRTAIGYYEPGHYVFVVVDGRQEDSNGMSLDQLAAFFEGLGVQVAYNLDGGKTSAMTFGGQLVNQPAQGGRTTSDIIYIGE